MIGNRQSAIGNRQSAIGNRQSSLAIKFNLLTCQQAPSRPLRQLAEGEIQPRDNIQPFHFLISYFLPLTSFLLYQLYQLRHLYQLSSSWSTG
jgi:hypothetical protein